MRSFDPYYKIDGQPMLAADAGVRLQFSDIDDADAGRDEAGFLHRSLVRSKVPTWGFTYSFLTGEELAYLQALLGEKDTFTFTYGEKSCTAYCAKLEVSLFDRTHGLYQGLQFHVIGC